MVPKTAHRGVILGIILLSYFMILLDNSVVFTAVPAIRAELQLSAVQLSWVQDAYTLVFGGFLLLGARAGDLLGRRRVFVFGLVVFSVASLLVGLAQSSWWIIGSRALQGVGAAVLGPSSLSLLMASFPEGPERSRAVAWYGATAGIGASLGLVIGGAFTQLLSWRAGFFINVPIGLVMLLLAPRFLPETSRVAGRFDTVGAITATGGIAALVFAILNSVDSGWDAPLTLSSLAVGLVLLAFLVFNERAAAEPIMPLRLFANRERVGAYLARFCYLAAMIGFFFFTTQFMQNVLGMTPLAAGLGFLPMTLVNFAVAMRIPKITTRFGLALPLLVGVLLTLAGMLWLSRLTVGSGYLVGVALPMLLIGAGQGLAFAPLTSAGIVGVRATDAGAASGLVNTFHQMGTSLGLATLVAVAATVPVAGLSSSDALTRQISAALTTGSGFLLAALVAVLLLIAPAHKPYRTKER